MLQKIKSSANKAIKRAPRFVALRMVKMIALVLVLATAMTALIYATHTVRVSDGNNTYVMTTVFGNAQNMTKKIAGSADYKITGVTRGLYSTDVTISYYFPLTLTVGNNTKTYSITEGRLGDILSSLGVKLDEYDILSHTLDTTISGETYVDIVDVEYKTETYSEEIPYGSTVEYSDKYYATTQKVENGHTGSKIVTCSVMYVNGVAAGKTVINEEIVAEAVDTKTVIGTKAPKYASSGSTISTLDVPSDLQLDSNGIPLNYKSVKTLKATAYTHTGNRCSTGVWPEPGYVAVDPKEIPYGTRMYIVSSDGRYNYGYAIAADTGGFIHGNRTDMDLFMDTESQCIYFGRRDITVYFLD